MASSAKVAPYGSWKSSISSSMLIGGNCKSICELQTHGDSVFWIEQTFPHGKRVVFQSTLQQAEPTQWTPGTMNIKNTVHEYGGGSFYPTPEGGIVFTESDSILELGEPLGAPKTIFKARDADVRRADLFVHATDLYAVSEAHVANGDPTNLIVKIERDTGVVTEIASGADFYAAARVSKDGKHLAWVQWDNPNMPWDKTSVFVAELEGGKPVSPKQIASGASNYGLTWSDGTIYFVSDQTGFWNVYTYNVETGETRNVWQVDKEIGSPLWQFADDRPYAVEHGMLVMATDTQLYRLNTKTHESPTPIDSVAAAGFTSFQFLSISKGILYCVAAGPTKPQSLIAVDLGTDKVKVLRETRSSDELERLDISVPESINFKSEGVAVQAYLYRPYNKEYAGPDGDLPPLVVMAHAGPTARTYDTLDLRKQYFTSRGFAVVDVNYRGSTGFGTEFRNMLVGKWGEADVIDAISAAEYLIQEGRVDPQKVCIVGSSASGLVALNAVMNPKKIFSAAVSSYGVADLEGLIKDTHKFERCYSELLIAKYPEEKDVYLKRSPINNIDKINTPVCFMHGTVDPVVPVEQSQMLYEALLKKGVPTALVLFEGESHGFRRAETIQTAIDTTYVFVAKVFGIEPSVECEVKIDNMERAAHKL